MNRKLILTKLNEYIMTAVLENDKIVELHPSKNVEQGIALGNIYIGKAKNIVANIGAAFIEVAPGVECYYSLSEKCMPYFTRKNGKKPLCIGDELIVQVSGEAMKTKQPTVTAKFNIAGKYAVLTHGDARIGTSTKLPKEEKERLQHIAETFSSEEYGYIVRTNARNVPDDMLCHELKLLADEYQEICQKAPSRVCFSCLKKAPKAYLTDLKNIYQEGLSDIVIEDAQMYEEAKAYLEMYQPEDLSKLRLYQDDMLPLHKLYAIEKEVQHALKEQVWLKSGAYLVIQPTEALTVIDVNTGKCISKKRDDETFYRINLEAAKEAARQIRLRNISGIILIDFINMSDQDKTDSLLEELRKEFKKDSVETNLVDMTKLHLVEITRKKIRKPLRENFSL